jgi:CubicO group peptidase (beta-lactamase class C family)
MKTVAGSRKQVACALLLLLTASAGAQQAPERRALSSRERGALRRALHDSLHRILQAAQQDSAFPGAYAIVGDSRGILAEAGVGRIDWAKSPRPNARTLWDLASLTKVIGTTSALAQLVEAGKVTLDAPVQRYVPEWTGPGQDSVTVAHLLTHTSGLPSFRPYDRQTQVPDSLTRLLFATPLERSAGDSMVYSDIGAFMMGQVIERVSGERLDQYLRRHVFEPLGMRETMFNPPGSMYDRVAPTEIDTLRGGLVRGKVHDERAYYLGGVAAHAGLFSSAADLSRFARMLLNGGILDGHRVFAPGTITTFSAYADSARHNRALGWQKPIAPWSGRSMSSRAFGHTGFTGTSIAIDPELDLYIILLSNRVNPTRNNNRIGRVRSRLADAIVSTVRERRGPTLNTPKP